MKASDRCVTGVWRQLHEAPGIHMRVVAVRGLLAATVLLTVLSSATAGVVAWWTEPDVQARLKLTPQQVSTLNRLFEETLSERLASRARLITLEEALAQLMARPDASEADTLRLAEKVESVRARRNIARTMMLVRMFRVLTPAQRRALDSVAPRRPPHTLP